MLQQSILGGWQFVLCSISVTEQFPSCLIDRAQGTGFVIPVNLKFQEIILVDIQQLEGMIGQIHKCLRDVFIDLLRLPNDLLPLTFKARVVSQPENA